MSESKPIAAADIVSVEKVYRRWNVIHMDTEFNVTVLAHAEQHAEARQIAIQLAEKLGCQFAEMVWP